MSEMSPEFPQDPFASPEATDIMRTLNSFYVAAQQEGFPEERAYGLVHDLFMVYATAWAAKAE